MTSIWQKTRAMPLAFIFVLGACGPTRPPSIALDPAVHALTEARAANASMYAPMELRFAEERLAQAQIATTKHSHDEAEYRALESHINSELALAKTRLSKTREAVEQLKQQNKELRHSILNSNNPSEDSAQ